MNDERPVLLLVDDEPLDLEFLTDVLQSDYRIKIATNKPAALELTRQDPYLDLILLDVSAPPGWWRFPNRRRSDHCSGR